MEPLKSSPTPVSVVSASRIALVISAAPPANHYDFAFLAPCPSSGIIIHGSADDVVPEPDVAKLAHRLANQKNVISVDYEIIEGAIIEASEKSARLATAQELDILTNLRMTIPGFVDGENDQVFAKVTEVLDGDDIRHHYRINLTSASSAIRKFILSRVVA